ncbi:hypothetical protein CDAR_298731 [Caerostris darwini]|uniref:Uncharacterized protein n=1 Tax=Caerostris darwini TaxID=1538125 RepID=A0AAV4MST8_9ARAC|nr:hypothetical protein CDAR_298731 [Caerostris darwini]
MSLPTVSSVEVDPHAARATLTLSNLDMLMHINFFTSNGRDVSVDIAWVHLREGYPGNVHLVVVDLTDCLFTAHDCRENKYISRRDHAVHWPLKKPTRRGCVQKVIKLKEVKGYLSQFNTVDPHHGWPLFIGVLVYRQERFLKEYCGFNSVVNMYRECPRHISMMMDMEAKWSNVPISPRFHKGFHREKNAKCSRYMVWHHLLSLPLRETTRHLQKMSDVANATFESILVDLYYANSTTLPKSTQDYLDQVLSPPTEMNMDLDFLDNLESLPVVGPDG